MDRMGGDIDVGDKRPGAIVSGTGRCSGERTIRSTTATSENSSEKADVIFPSEVSMKLSVFDRFATYVSARTSQAWFFVVCVIIVVLWAPSFFLLGTIDTWQLTINTVTFLESSGAQGAHDRIGSTSHHHPKAIE
jgi:hypothetical protein